MNSAMLWMIAGVLFLVACDRGTLSPSPTPTPSALPTRVTAPSPVPPREVPGHFQRLTYDWRTDFTRYSVDPEELLPGGPPKDGIPALDSPKFVSVAEGSRFLKDREPVVSFELGGEARAYPLQILIWHEIVNDQVASVPVLVTFCPLCNTAIAFDRRLEGQVLDFGTTGFLRHSDLVMYDRQTESWWQQITGEALVGELTGKRLAFLPASIVSWGDFARAFPQGRVLSQDTGHTRAYGLNPYLGYDDIDSVPFLFRGPLDRRVPPMERVVTVSLGEKDVAYPFSILEKKGVVNDVVAGQPLAVFFLLGTASALNQSDIASSRDVGAAAVFKPWAGGRKLTFRFQDGGIFDDQAGSQWNILGQAVSGPMQGQRLEPVVHATHFWFAWVVFKPDTTVYELR